jgi:hypothetical protein
VEADNLVDLPSRAPTVTKITDTNTANSDHPVDTGRTPAFRPGTKQAAVIDMLQRDTGSSLTDLAAATGWLPHTVRAALTGLRKRGMVITRAKVAGETRYIIVEGVL